MERATIEWSGLGPAGSQTLETLPDDLGETSPGFADSNFPIGRLRLRSGAILVANGRRTSTQSVTIGGTVSNPSDVTIVPDTVPCIDDVHVDGLVNGTASASSWPARAPARIDGPGGPGERSPVRNPTLRTPFPALGFSGNSIGLPRPLPGTLRSEAPSRLASRSPQMNPVRRRLLVTIAALSSATAVHGQTVSDLYPELARLFPSAATNDNARAGTAVAIDGDTLVVGQPFDTVGSAVNQGSVTVFVRNGSTWTEQATLTSDIGAAHDNFGASVAIFGDLLAVGAPGDDVGTSTNEGSVTLFLRDGTDWYRFQSLAGASSANDEFGTSVAIDGTTIAVGSPGDDVSFADQGSVQVFSSDLGFGLFLLETTLVGVGGAAGDAFGHSVALEGDLLVVGAPLDNVGSNADQGSVTVFTRSGVTWSAQGLSNVTGTALENFGYRVAIDGQTVVASAPFKTIGGNANQGTAHVYVKSGSSWVRQASLVASAGQADETLGAGLAIKGDVIAAGRPVANVGEHVRAGNVTIFRRSGTSWTEQTTCVAAEGAFNDNLGRAVAMSENVIACGVPNDNLDGVLDRGSVVLFGNFNVWNPTRRLGFDGLAASIAGSLNGDRLIANNRAFAAETGVIDASQKRFSLVAIEPVTLPQPVIMTLATGTVFEKSPDVAAGGLTVAGKLIAPVGGTLTFEQLSVANEGQFMQRGSSVLVNQGLSTTNGGACYLEGSILAEGVSTAVGGQNRVAADTNVFGDYTNAGATIVQRGVLYIYGTLINTGTMTGDIDNGLLPPTAGDGYSIGGDYVVGADASLVLPDPVWWLRVGGNLDIAIDDPSRFVMDRATIELTGLGPAGSQTLETLADDLGATVSGFDASNFPIGSLRLRAGATVELVDAHSNVPGKAAETLYVRSLVVPAGATLVTNGLRIYAETASITGTVSNVADIIILPEAPTCPADLNDDGFVDGYDLSIMLGFWNTNPTSMPQADINADGVVNAIDLGFVLAGWGACPE